MNNLFEIVASHAPAQITGRHVVPARGEELSQWPRWVAPQVIHALELRGVQRPWSHQAQAADLLYTGHHTVLATGTGSGKSLAAWVPALSAIENFSTDDGEIATAHSQNNEKRDFTEHVNQGRTDIAQYNFAGYAENVEDAENTGGTRDTGVTSISNAASQSKTDGFAPLSGSATLSEAAPASSVAVSSITGTGVATPSNSAAANSGISSSMLQQHRARSLTDIHRKPTTLYLSPTKALAADQEHHLIDLAHLTNPHIGIATVDGDADRSTRLWARDYADIVLTNPDFLHFAIASRHEAWARFLRGLRFVVIDEFHAYRGRFGANVALIVRRILRIARHYGANPHVLFLSATSAAPESTAERFIGTAFGSIHAVIHDGSPQGERTIVAMQCKEFPRVHSNVSTPGKAVADRLESSASNGDLRISQGDGERERSGNEGSSELTQTPIAAERPGLTIELKHSGADFMPLCQEGAGEQEASGIGITSEYLGSSIEPEVSYTEHTRESSHDEIDFETFQIDDPDVSRLDDDLVLNTATSNIDFMRRSANTEAGDVTARLVTAGAQVLTFVRSRPGTERVAEVAQQILHLRAPHLEDRVAAYRGGYLPEERRELERKIRSGELQALATTSALELGIDISQLDAVIVTGWPGTHASFQQQIGRAGRAGGEGLGIFIARDNPLDQFMVEHPEQLVDSSTEVNVFDPHNPWILPNHLCAAAAELPLTQSDAEIFGLTDTSYFSELEAQQLLKQRPTGWYWNTSLHITAHSLVDVRGDGGNVNIIDSENGSLLGTIDAAQVDLTAYPGAIYIHQGIPFEVEHVDGDVALVHRHRDEELRTYPTEENFVDIVQTLEHRELRHVTWNYGYVSVRNRVVSYDIHRARDGLYLGTVPLQMPQRQFETTGIWFTIDAEASRKLGLDSALLPGALHAAEHTMIALLPLFATCDRWDLGGMSTAIHPDTGCATVIIHDAEAGGSGCAERGYHAARAWAQATLERLTNCQCADGCPQCVQSPKCGNNNSPLSKPGAIALFELLVSEL